LKAITNGSEGVAESEFSAVAVDEFEIGSDEILVGRYEGEIVEFSGLEDSFGSGFLHEQVVSAEAIGILGESETAAGVGLRIAVDEKSFDAEGGGTGGEVDGGGGLTDTAFLVRDR
jgi:hypothetical protein